MSYICSRTANKYIPFYELLVVYPRIIICDIAFETIMYCKENIVEELRGDYELRIRFQVPLRDIQIYVDMEISRNDLACLGNDEDGLFTVDDNNDCNAAWDIYDDIVADEAEI